MLNNTELKYLWLIGAVTVGWTMFFLGVIYV